MKYDLIEIEISNEYVSNISDNLSFLENNPGEYNIYRTL